MAGYIGSKASVVSSGAERKKTFDITGTTTSLTGLSYTVNQVHVFHNGVRLVDGTDFTATNGSSITLTSAAESGDEVVVISYAGYQVSDTVSASQGGTFAGDVTMSGNLNTTDVLPSTDSTSDLGSTSKRFQDLYLSGGVYLGGTGSANKLDDYEEGTWTVAADFASTSPSSGATTGTGVYTKVGNSITVWGQCSNINVTGAAGNIIITGLPFASKLNASLALYAGTVRFSQVNIANSYCVVEVRDGASYIFIMEMIDDANSANLTAGDFIHGNSDIFFTLTYQTS